MLNASYFYKETWQECYRLLKPDGAMWVFNSWRSFPCLMKGMVDAGRSMESLLVWDKDCMGTGGTKGLRPSYEVVALSCKGDFAISNRSIRDVQRFKWRTYKPNHPAEKPVELIKWLISISGNAHLILDPFLGSGTTLLAAKELGRTALGFEVNSAYEQTIRRRALLDASSDPDIGYSRTANT